MFIRQIFAHNPEIKASLSDEMREFPHQESTVALQILM
jgi:hypothetical protein